jgi:hypothetical protein
MGIFSTPLSTFGQTPRVLSGTVHVHLSEEVLALIIWHLPLAEKQRLRAVSPTFLQNALQARYGACLLVGEPPTSESEKLRPHDAKHARLFAHMRRLRCAVMHLLAQNHTSLTLHDQRPVHRAARTRSNALPTPLPHPE